jgi:hypothetical protein
VITLKERKQECAATERLLNKFQVQVKIERINSPAANDATVFQVISDVLFVA